VVRKLVYNDELSNAQRALNSAVECHLHTVEVVGSNPTAPTIYPRSPMAGGAHTTAVPEGRLGRTTIPRFSYQRR
jgi:hypothetical protein